MLIIPGNRVICDLLVSKGADTALEDDLGHTAAWHAMDAGHTSVRNTIEPRDDLPAETPVRQVPLPSLISRFYPYADNLHQWFKLTDHQLQLFIQSYSSICLTRWFAWPAPLRLKWINKFRSRGREHSLAVRNQCWIQDGLWSDQSCPLPTLTPWLEPNDRSRFHNSCSEPHDFYRYSRTTRGFAKSHYHGQ